MHLVGQRRGLPCDRNPVEVDSYAALRGLAELHEVAREPVREVDHRRGEDLLLTQRFDDVGARAGLEVLLEQVFVALELRFGVLDVGKDALFALEQPQAHVGGAEVARQADQVVLPGSAAVDNLLLRGMPQGRQADRQSVHRGPRVAADEVDLLFLAGEAYPFVEVLQGLYGQLGRDAQRDGQLRGTGVHGQQVADGRHDLVSQVFEREVGEVEIDPLEEGVGRTEHRLTGRGHDHGGIVADTPQGRGVPCGKILRQQVDESELAQRGDLGAFLGFHGNVKFFTNLTILCRFSKITVILSEQSQKRIRL